MASETMALSESANAGHFVVLMTKEIFGLRTDPRVFCKTDNKSLEKHLKCLFCQYCTSGEKTKFVWNTLCVNILLRLTVVKRENILNAVAMNECCCY